MQRLQQHPLPQQLWLRASGPAGVMQKRLVLLQAEVERAGLVCKALDSLLFARVTRSCCSVVECQAFPVSQR